MAHVTWGSRDGDYLEDAYDVNMVAVVIYIQKTF